MIHFCCCTRRSASIPKPSEDSEGSDSCKTCGGKPIGDQGFLMSTVEPELSGVSDPYLNWKLSSKGRRRAVRRPRTSFISVIGKQPTINGSKMSRDTIGKGSKKIGSNKKKSTTKSVKGSEGLDDKGPRRTGGNFKKSTSKNSKENRDFTDKESSKTGGMSVSEYEKLGVSILGKRFSDTTNFFPIKKRNIHLVWSPTLPLQFPFHSDGSDNQSEPDQVKFTADGNTNLKEIKEGFYEVPDFSGISLLASAACDSTITEDIMNVEGSVCKAHSSEGDGTSRSNESCSSSLVKEDKLFNICGDFNVKTNAASSLNNAQNIANGIEASSQNHKFNWDLNTAFELWEDALDEDVDAKPLVDNIVNSIVNEEPCQGQAGHDDAIRAHQLLDISVDLRTVADDYALIGSKVPDKLVLSCQSSIAEHGVEKECQFTSRVDGSAQAEESLLEGDLVLENGIAEETECSSPDGGTLPPERGYLLDASTLKEGKADTYPACKISVVEIETQSPHLVSTENAILAHAAGRSGDVSHVDGGRNVNSKLEVSSCSSDSHPFTCIGSSNPDELSSGSTSAAGHVTTTMDVKMKNKCSVMADENSNITKSDEPIHIVSNSSTCDLADTLPGIAVAPPPDAALSSHGTCKSYVESFRNSPGEVGLGDHADRGYDSHASQTGTDQVTGLEKLVSDDDSQYEDGEFRGSIINGWGDDEAEDEETELVDYGSDNREVDGEASALNFDSAECKNMGLSEVGIANRDVSSGLGKKSSINITKYSDVVKKYTNVSEGTHGARESLHSPSMGLKSLELDQWPEGCRSSKDGSMNSRVEPANRDRTAATFNSSNVGGSWRSAVGMTSRQYLPSLTQRPKFSEASHRRERYCAKASRSGEVGEPDFKFGDVNNGRYYRRGRPSRPMHNKGQGDHWVDSRNHLVPDSSDAPGHHGTDNFTHSGSKNAVAAVTAKLESNGFVIAPDGTILKAGGARRPGCLPSQSTYASSQRTCVSVRRRSPIERSGSFALQRGLENPRAMSPDRHINVSQGRTDRYGPGMVRTGGRDNYLASKRNHKPLYRREQNFSPRRRPLHRSRSRTRSPSRSRTRSPMWAHPSDSNDHGMNRSPVMRRRNRSPYFKSEVTEERIRSQMRERTRSPHPRCGFKRMTGYVPSARSHTSPLHDSRWTDERNESPIRVRECNYKRSSERRLCTRVFSQDHRSDPMESVERLKPDECYRPMRSGRLPDYVNVGRGPRHASSQRSRNDKCEMLHLTRQCDIDGNMEDLQYALEVDGPRVNNLQPKISSELHRKGSPASFDKTTDSQLRISPQRAAGGEILDMVEMGRTMQE